MSNNDEVVDFLFGPDQDTARPPHRFLARIPIPFPLPFSLWMHVSALQVCYFVTTRRVPFSALFVLGMYLVSKKFHSLWCIVKIGQLRAVFDAMLAKGGTCEGCRDRAFACRKCMVLLLAGRLRHVRPDLGGEEEVD